VGNLKEEDSMNKAVAAMPRMFGLALLLAFLGGCGSDPDAPAVTGTVTYLERIAMPQGAIVTVRLQDVSLADVSAVLLAEQVITNPGNVPVPYRVEYDGTLINPARNYAVRADIRVGGTLWATTTRSYPVITRGNPSTGVEILVERVP
jgi:putative lipoprotein